MTELERLRVEKRDADFARVSEEDKNAVIEGTRVIVNVVVCEDSCVSERDVDFCRSLIELLSLDVALRDSLAIV